MENDKNGNLAISGENTKLNEITEKREKEK
jgi:hypothetical protein